LNLGGEVVDYENEKDCRAHPCVHPLGLSCDADHTEAPGIQRDSSMALASASNDVCDAEGFGCLVPCPCLHHCTFVGGTESTRVNVYVCGLKESAGGTGSHHEEG
jgi:hypothetical protein